ncbi:bifunctional 2-C-methyl-D-erythritol 4-phosphate cytidylyltransferase/2-C-methyl-D-erythritol 2,4-cyclodiphosphate synthase [Aureimonas sp. ME7]|uniref:bifunctional 2-C-methyl-D-erythritol 4-phosphate cytidylyltransferase/2-C-methyl-D-erythritol 2,4-cyclodiphosphate synthase n=1 Tax=Aureimonas sp. ME7 TaxID=2744252 RepID=UPI0015F5D79F|nr:bifunctional 2-C-methyl-D-erythritol 4-phosphate cytidylyltransferase/2-C-methyl-D-erythritol 2,4-cyclodiphosphate synthase [Aureimonas sp. ME7]
MSVAAILVAAGRGSRAGQTIDGPKQYFRIAGRSVLARTLSTFEASPQIGEIVVVVHADDQALAMEAIAHSAGRARLVVGGATRQASVRAGLDALVEADPEIVLIHDAVRPFVSERTIADVVDRVRAASAAIPALPVADTLKKAAAGTIVATLDRTGVHTAQTPQGFRFPLIREAHHRAADIAEGKFTDDASIAEWAGISVALVPGDPDNVKLTTKRDLEMAAEKLTGAPAMIDVRVGNGYDVHQLVPGDGVTLCGVWIPHDQALLGHSDADVGFHALTDALLATCGAGDIGTHFPPSDPQWKGAASKLFLKHAADLVASRGGRICNVDVTLICEAPKVGPHRDAMTDVIASVTGLGPARISIKATTNETIGFIGRREGIAAIATASVVYADQ